MELYADIERMVRDLNGLHKLAGRRGARDLHALIFNLLAEIVVELITMAMASEIISRRQPRPMMVFGRILHG